MPNWCYNYLEIDGPDDLVEKFVKGIDVEKGFIETYYPTPPELLADDLPVVNQFIDGNNGISEEELARRKALIEKYGSTDWYNWRLSHWGTKWGDCELDIQEGGFMRFDTAWSPPLEALEYIATLFPGLIFTLEYEEDGLCFAGKAVISSTLCSHESWDTQWNEETQEMERVE